MYNITSKHFSIRDSCRWLCVFQLTAEDKQQFHELLAQLPGPINEAAQIAGELAKNLKKDECSTSKVYTSQALILMYL